MMKTARQFTVNKNILGLLLCAAGMAAPLPGRSAAPARTIIESERIEMRGGEDRNFFYFEDQVQVVGTNLLLQCDRLEVTAARKGGKNATAGEIGSIQKVAAAGRVVIEQAGRQAYCGRADFDPAAGEVVLSENPKVVDAGAEVRGWKIVIRTGTRQAEVLSNPDAQTASERATVVLDALPDFGFTKEKQQETARPQPKGNEAEAAPARKE